MVANFDLHIHFKRVLRSGAVFRFAVLLVWLAVDEGTLSTLLVNINEEPCID